MNREELIRIVVWQYAVVGVVCAIVWLFWGTNAGLSALAGGMCVAVPNSVFALNLLIGLIVRRPVKPAGVIIGEFLKIFAVLTLFALTVKLFQELNWPAMLVGIIAGAFGQFALIFVKH